MTSTDEQLAVTTLTLLDGRTFRFRYNPYAEVAEIVYPGGGVSRIDYVPYGSQICETNLLGGVSNRGVRWQHIGCDLDILGGLVESGWPELSGAEGRSQGLLE
jgi:YD repeat-containing protein